MTNVGHSVAEHVAYRPILIVNDKGRADQHECELPSLEIAGNIAKGAQAGIAVFPNQTITLPEGTGWVGGIEQALANHLRKNEPPTIWLTLIGCVIYSSDADKNIHYTKYVFNIFPLGEKGSRDLGLMGWTDISLQMDPSRTEVR